LESPLRWRVLLIIFFPDALGLRMALYSLDAPLGLRITATSFAALPDRTGVAAGFERALLGNWKLASGTATALVGLMDRTKPDRRPDSDLKDETLGCE
jgi:hypothetical protein